MKAIMKSYSIYNDVRGASYKALVDFVGSQASYIQLIAHDGSVTRSCRETLRRFQDFDETVERVNEWPGTRLDGTAFLHRFHVSPDSLGFVRRHVDSLFSWCWPDNPEDLSFIAEDGTVLLLTTAHESYAELALRNDMNVPSFLRDLQPAYRDFTMEEKGLIPFLLRAANMDDDHVARFFMQMRCVEINDGGMGSLRFVPIDNMPVVNTQKFEGVISSCNFSDEDGVLVSVALYADSFGNPFELDMWKVDFTPLVRIPSDPGKFTLDDTVG